MRAEQQITGARKRNWSKRSSGLERSDRIEDARVAKVFGYFDC